MDDTDHPARATIGTQVTTHTRAHTYETKQQLSRLVQVAQAAISHYDETQLLVMYTALIRKNNASAKTAF